MKFHGTLGIKQDEVEIAPGIRTSDIQEVVVSGDLNSQSSRWRSGELQQDTTRTGAVLTLTASEELSDKMLKLVYVIWLNRKWKIEHVEISRPRVHISLGALYNE